MHSKRAGNRNENGAVRFLTIASIVIGAVGVLAYCNSLNGEFVFDDEDNIVQNGFLRMDQLTAQTIQAAAFGGVSQSRPVANLTFAANYYFGQLNVRGYHLVNIAIHLFSGILVYLVALEIFTQSNCLPDQLQRSFDRSTTRWTSLFVACIFVVHPLQTQSVTYIVQRMTSLAAMFCFASFLMYILAHKSGHADRWTLWVGCLFLWGLSLGTKQNAVALPFFVLLYEWYFVADLDVGKYSRSPKNLVGVLAVMTGVLAAVGVFILVNMDFNPIEILQSGYERRDFTMWQRLATQPRVVVFYMSALVCPFPSRLNLLHDITISNSLVDPIATTYAYLVIAGFLYLAVVLARRRRLVSFAILWFFGNLAIESSFIPLEMVFEHRLYIPMFGFALFVGWLFSNVLARRRSECLVAMGSSVVLLAALTYSRNEVWSDAVTLWSDVLAKHTHSYRARLNRGNAYKNDNELNLAIADFQQAISIDPDDPRAFNNLGLSFAQKRDWEKARRQFEKVIDMEPGYSDAHYNLGVLYLSQNKLNEAEKHFKDAIVVRPNYAEALNNIGMIYTKRGDFKQAWDWFVRAYELQPNAISIQRNLAACYAILQKAEGQRSGPKTNGPGT